LCQRNRNVRAGYRFRKITFFPFFLSILPVLLITFLQKHKSMSSRWFTWEEIKEMVNLKRLNHVLQQKTTNNCAAIVLDHEPVYLLTWLHAFVLDDIKNRSLKNWWNEMLNQCASLLDIIIWLDAPESILAERIKNRDCNHRIKEKPEQAIFDFLERYRRSYKYVISRLTANGGPKVFNIDTDKESPDRVVNKIFDILDRQRNER
jgi:deoxyadenosine/deoxycytidine kinase